MVPPCPKASIWDSTRPGIRRPRKVPWRDPSGEVRKPYSMAFPLFSPSNPPFCSRANGISPQASPSPGKYLPRLARSRPQGAFRQRNISPSSQAPGFFAGIDVTPPPFEAFSFRHLDALLLKIDSADLVYDKVWWTVVARTSRRTGRRSEGAKPTKGAP